MKFVLEVDLSAVAGDPVEELGRILRYWAGNVKHYEPAAGTGETVRDSAYAPVGAWRFDDG